MHESRLRFMSCMVPLGLTGRHVLRRTAIVSARSAGRHGGCCRRREIDKSLGKAGVLTALDRSQLTLYCQMVARWREAETRVPYEPLPASYAATIAGIASKLGLNVADRAKLRLPEPMQRDPLAELLDDAG